MTKKTSIIPSSKHTPRPHLAILVALNPIMLSMHIVIYPKRAIHKRRKPSPKRRKVHDRDLFPSHIRISIELSTFFSSPSSFDKKYI